MVNVSLRRRQSSPPSRAREDACAPQWRLGEGSGPGLGPGGLTAAFQVEPPGEVAALSLQAQSVLTGRTENTGTRAMLYLSSQAKTKPIAFL